MAIMNDMKLSPVVPGLPQDAEVLVRLPVLEQSMAWLVERGPLVTSPPLPTWALYRLVHQRRIIRLQRDTFVAPYPDGSMPSVEEVVARHDPTAYVSFAAALAYHGLNDQDPTDVVALTQAAKAELRYGIRRVNLTRGRRASSSPRTITALIGHTQCRIATPEQALLDCLRNPNLGPPLYSVARALRTLMSMSPSACLWLRNKVTASKSPTLARRLGFLIEVLTDVVDNALVTQGHRNHTSSAFSDLPTHEHQPLWRLDLPMSRDQLLREMRA